MPTPSIPRDDVPAPARAVPLLALAALLSSPAFAQTSVSEAGVGSIIIPVAYAADAEGNAAGVRLAASPPAFFAVSGDTAPAALAPGQVGHFSYSYLVGQGAPLGPFSVPFAYADPPGTWESVDEEGISADFEVVPAPVPAGDTVPPTTSRQVEGNSFSDGHVVFVAAPAHVALSAADLATPLSPASGVAATRYLLDSVFVDSVTTPGTLYVGEPIALTPGAHVFSYYSVDAAGNVEPLKVSSVTVDAAPPLISGLSPAGGEAFGAAVASFTMSWSVSDDWTPFTASGRLVQLEDRGVARGTAPAELAVTPGQTLQAAGLDDGLWELSVSATDFVLNASSRSSGAFQIVRPDFLPPHTSLTIGSPSLPGITTYIGANTPLALSALDDLTALGDGVGTGVAYSSYSVDSESLLVNSRKNVTEGLAVPLVVKTLSHCRCWTQSSLSTPLLCRCAVLSCFPTGRRCRI